MNIPFLKELSEASGVPGQETRLREIIIREIQPHVDTYQIDPLGNLIGHRKGDGKKLMLAAHMDEIGFIVRHIDSKGFIRIQPLGGFDPRQLFSQRVILHTDDGKALPGILSYAGKPTHLQTGDESKQAPKMENFFIDTGLSPEEVKDNISIGNMITMDRECKPCGDTLIGKSLDNRVGVFVMIEAIKKASSTVADIYPVATVQEEIGLRGALTSAYAVSPDFAIAIDTTIAGDVPGNEEASYVTTLGKGVAIKMMDSSLICHPPLVKAMRRLCEENQIPHQLELLPRGGTDGGSIQRSRGGVPTAVISIPTRYIHTVNEMVHPIDVQAAIDLLATLLEEIQNIEVY